MSSKQIALGGLLAIVAISNVGCIQRGPYLGFAAYPIPVSPFFQDKKEDEFWEHERYERVPILGPITQGGVPQALDPPSDDEILRALEKVDPVEGGFPFLHERQRSNIQITKCLVADYVDPPRVYPMIGPAQQHHAHYKCTVYYTSTVRVGWPIPHTLRDEDSREVIYIDHNHLHMVGPVDPGICSDY